MYESCYEFSSEFVGSQKPAGQILKSKKAAMDSVYGTIFELNWKSEKPIRPNSKRRIRNNFRLELIEDLST